MPEDIGAVANKVVSVKNIFLWIWSHWNFILSSLVIISLLIVASNQALKEKSPQPFIDQFAGRLASADYLAGDYADSLINNKGLYQPNYQDSKSLDWFKDFANKVISIMTNIGEFFKMLWNRFVISWLLFCNLWFIYIVFHLFYKIFEMKNHDDAFANILMAFAILGIMQIVYKFSISFIVNQTQLIQLISYLGIIFFIGGGLVLVTIFAQNNTRFIIGLFLSILIIAGTVAGITFQKNEAVNKVTDNLIVFTGIWKIVTFIPKIFTPSISNYIISQNNMPNPQQQ